MDDQLGKSHHSINEDFDDEIEDMVDEYVQSSGNCKTSNKLVSKNMKEREISEDDEIKDEAIDASLNVSNEVRKTQKELHKLSEHEGLPKKISEALKTYANSMKHNEASHRNDNMTIIRQQIANLIHDSNRLDDFNEAINRASRQATLSPLPASRPAQPRHSIVARSLRGAIEAGRQLDGQRDDHGRLNTIARRERELIERERKIYAKEMALEALQVKIEGAIELAKTEAAEKRAKDPLYDLSQNNVHDYEAFKLLDSRLKIAFNDLLVPAEDAENLKDREIIERIEALNTKIEHAELRERESRLAELRRIEKDKVDKIAATLERERTRVDMLAKQMAKHMYDTDKQLGVDEDAVKRHGYSRGYGRPDKTEVDRPVSRKAERFANNSSMQMSDYPENDEKLKSISWISDFTNSFK